MTDEEIQELRQELLATPHENLVEMFIKLKRREQQIVAEYEKMDYQLDKISYIVKDRITIDMSIFDQDCK